MNGSRKSTRVLKAVLFERHICFNFDAHSPNRILLSWVFWFIFCPFQGGSSNAVPFSFLHFVVDKVLFCAMISSKQTLIRRLWRLGSVTVTFPGLCYFIFFFLLIILMSTTHPQYLCLWRRKKTHVYVYFKPITEAKLVTATKLEVPQIEHFKTFSYSFTLK